MLKEVQQLPTQPWKQLLKKSEKYKNTKTNNNKKNRKKKNTNKQKHPPPKKKRKAHTQPTYIVCLDVTKVYGKTFLDVTMYAMHKEGLDTSEWNIVKKLNENVNAKLHA